MSKETLNEKILNLRTAVVSAVLRKNKIKHSTNVLEKIIVNKDNFSTYNYFALRKNIKRKIIIFFIILTTILIFGFLFFTFQARADSLRIIDGDTIVLNGEKIRFSGIDAPEYKQDCINGDLLIYCGMFSKVLLTKKIGDETPKCISEGKDVYGRTLAECFVNGESLSSFLVRHGYAFAYRKYSKKFVKDEEHAKKIKIGMWAMKFEFPWDFRKNKIADNPSERCGVELAAKLEGFMVWLTEELPHIEPAINLNCKIQIMNLKELTEEDKEKLKKHEIELSDENNKIV